MDFSFDALAAEYRLSEDVDRRLREAGFVVMPGPVPAGALASLAEAYDVAVASASHADRSVGSTTTRVHDLVNRGAAFDALYVFPPLLAACCRVIGRPFRLSTMVARTLRARTGPQELHVDFRRDAEGSPMVGFILMVDE